MTGPCPTERVSRTLTSIRHDIDRFDREDILDRHRLPDWDLWNEDYTDEDGCA